ncbi:MAG: tetratricopeptide repeat protein [Tepidisphaeraceae bacterium]
MSASAPGMRHRVVIPAVLATITILIYLPTLGYDFVNYDDPVFISDNPQVRAGLTREGFIWAFKINGLSQWHPLVWLSHMLDCELFGLDPGGPHAVNVLIHTAATLLLYLFLLKTTAAPWRSAMAAALFGWHPTRVESVAWVCERRDVLCALFVFVTLLAYVRYVRRPGVARYGLVAAAYSLALASKPMAATLPGLMLLLDYWPLGRFTPKRPQDWRALLFLVLEKLPLLLMAIGAAWLSFLCQIAAKTVVASLADLPMGPRLANAAVSCVRYLRMAVLPTHLAVFYPRETWQAWQVATCVGILLAVTTAVVYSRKGYAIMGWFWFLASLVPVIGILQVGDQALADRYTYLPLVGIFVLLVWSIAEAAGRARRGLVVGASAIALTAYACASAIQVTHWQNSVTLFTHVLDVNERNYLAHYNLGVALAERGRLTEAAEHYARSAALSPNYLGPRINLGIVAEQLGDYALAERQLNVALSLGPTNRAARFAMARLRAQQGRHAEAVALYEQLTREYPVDLDAHVNLGASLEMLGERARAESAYRTALRINPNDPDARANLESLLAGGSHPKDGSEPPPASTP